MATTALVGVTTVVMKPLLSKLTKLLGEEYVKLRGVHAEQLNPETKLWRDKLRELAYDLEDCIDAFMARVDDRRDGPTGFEKYFCKLKRLKARHKIANQIKELKTSVMVASERHKRYEFAQNPSTSSVDPRLQALYTDIDKLVGIDGPKKHIIELLSMEMNGPSTKT
ncbi:hypothetical protein PAHAL_6G052300 [Panicum hallii]|uniref:Disease resistance N-terminal domain-containing protein n=1 Tax=Panicum hallii TaxID=206008 RepID=A0A2T8IF77_9POAL|nr:hypothetical protein PAHAL_6G052300 [Panicum hallii]